MIASLWSPWGKTRIPSDETRSDLGGSVRTSSVPFVPAFDFDPALSGTGGYVSNVAKQESRDHGKSTPQIREE